MAQKNSRALQRKVDLTTAVCQERLLATHVRHALGLVDLVSDQLPFDDALDIYVRILRLTPEQARNIGSRALAEIARRSGLPRVDPEELERAAEEEAEREREQEEEPTAAEPGVARSDALFSRLRRRVKGRVQEDLRHRIDLAAARTSDSLLEAHVQNGLVFGKALRDEMAVPEAVELYLETMAIPEGIGDVIYDRALRIIADDVLPPLPKRRDPTVEEGLRNIEAAQAEPAG